MSVYQMYATQRQELDGIDGNMSRPSRGSRFASGYVTVVVDKQAGTWTLDLSNDAIKAEKVKFQEQFPTATSIIDSYECVDQGEEGACSLVGFINCAQLSGKSITKARKDWLSLWNQAGHDAMSDIGEMLDTFAAKLGFLGFQYVPINGNPDEKYFNKSFWNPTECRSYWKISEEEYNKSPFVWENGFLIENLLLNNPVEINALEHSRTCIAVNEEHLLFADNWNPSVELVSNQLVNEKGKHDSRGTPIEYFASGFSRVNKWFIYSMMRDIVYFAPSRAKQKQKNQRLVVNRRNMSRKELVAIARGGKLKAYGVNGKSSSEDIKRALHRSKRER